MEDREKDYLEQIENYKIDNGLDQFIRGRVIAEHKDRYILRDSEKEYEAELIGNLRFTATGRHDLPAVGDWVAFSEYDEGKGLIHAVYPRMSILERQAVGKTGQGQIIATNVDFGLIIQAVDRDFSLNRFERYLTICNEANIQPIIVLSKVDLIEKAELLDIVGQIKTRLKIEKVIQVSNETVGYAEIEAILLPEKTYCLLGSSGVGKSTMVNALTEVAQMKTAEIGATTNKGRHTTSHRELFELSVGAFLIDNPGMREVGLTDAESGLAITFETILDYGENCKFSDCTHQHEKGCGILLALESGEIDEEAYANFQKMEKEKDYYESDVQERRKKDKDFGKMVKNVKKQRKTDKY